MSPKKNQVKITGIFDNKILLNYIHTVSNLLQLDAVAVSDFEFRRAMIFVVVTNL